MSSSLFCLLQAGKQGIQQLLAIVLFLISFIYTCCNLFAILRCCTFCVRSICGVSVHIRCVVIMLVLVCGRLCGHSCGGGCGGVGVHHRALVIVRMAVGRCLRLLLGGCRLAGWQGGQREKSCSAFLDQPSNPQLVTVVHRCVQSQNILT